MKTSTFFLIIFAISMFFLSMVALSYAVDQIADSLNAYGGMVFFEEMFKPLIHCVIGLASISLIVAIVAKFSGK